MKKENTVTYVYYAAIIAFSAGVFYWLNNLSGSQIKFLLDFYKNAVEFFFGNHHYYYEELGYYAGNNYIIGEKCLGLGITVLIFGVLSLLNVGKLNGFKRLLLTLTSGVTAVIVGVFANILRLISSIYFTVFARFELIHALLGIVIYLATVILCYALSLKLFIKKAGSEDIEVIKEHI